MTTAARDRFIATVQRRYGLTPREAEVLALTFAGVTSVEEQARRLYLSEQTVKHHRKAICAKTGRTNLLDAVVALGPTLTAGGAHLWGLALAFRHEQE